MLTRTRWWHAGVVATVSFLILVALSIGTVHAALISQTFEGNDCPAQPTCVANEDGTTTDGQGSPWIIKFNAEGDPLALGAPEINLLLFPTIDGSEFAFVDLTDNDKFLDSASWTYTPGPGDPEVRFWVAKGGPNYNLFYDNGPDNVGDADAVTSGTWLVPLNGPGNIPDLSHVSFYDTGGDAAVVPEPGTILLLGSGLVGLVGVGRRRLFQRGSRE